MLTRLRVKGFKNLMGVDVRLGPFTCVAGVNGAGKSNLFDAIGFLSALADRPFVEAALSVRDQGGRKGDVRSIFHRAGGQYDDEMSLEAEMIVPPEGSDDLGQRAEATTTFLRYAVALRLRGTDRGGPQNELELVREQLTHIRKRDTAEALPFAKGAPDWRDSVVKGKRYAPFYISTDESDGGRVIALHQDGGSRGMPVRRLAADLPRTVLSAVNAAESPTALLARREMQSWRRLQLEPSALRQPDDFRAPSRLALDGSHLPATLYHLANAGAPDASTRPPGAASDGRIYAQVGNRLAELLDDVRRLTVDRDEQRELLTLQVTGQDGTSHPARALSDGTLRFLALAVLEADPRAGGLLCLEEPENGIHPERIPAMLRLLQDIATDKGEAVGPDNPLRQVIVNTHSPAVVAQVPDDSLLVAELKEALVGKRRCQAAAFSCLPDTWRARRDERTRVVPKGRLLSYLNPVLREPEDTGSAGARASRRVVDREDLQPLLFPPGDLE